MEIPDTRNAPKKATFLGVTYFLNRSTHYYINNSKLLPRKGLHVAIYETISGQVVPKGLIVHHKDGNPLNNAFENFDLKTASQHTKRHPIRNIDLRKQNMNNARKIWNTSPEGKECHRKLALQNSLTKCNLPRFQRKCEVCGLIFKGTQITSRYCSKKCRWKAQRTRKKRPTE